jgi:hypothetical protein
LGVGATDGVETATDSVALLFESQAEATSAATTVVRLVARDVCDLSDANFDLWSPAFYNIAFRAPCNKRTLQLYNHTTQTTWQVGVAGQFASARVAAYGNYLYSPIPTMSSNRRGFRTGSMPG